MFGRKFSLADVFFKRDGTQCVTIFKLTHPHRHQQLMLVPTPRYGAVKFYEDWVYQPYARDNQLLISSDLYAPLNVAAPRSLMRHLKWFPGLTYFRMVDMPDCVDNNITRREFLAKERTFRAPVLRSFTTTPEFRDKNCFWVSRKISKLVGERYLTHPHETEQSYVLVLAPAQVAEGLNTLHTLGFEISDRTTVEVGNDAELTKLQTTGWISNMVFLGYIYGLFFMFLYNETERTRTAYLEHQEKKKAEAAARQQCEETAAKEYQ